MSLTEEQINIVNCANNIIVDCVVGSGKTRTILEIAENECSKSDNSRILILTYNKRLKTETRNKVVTKERVEVHSFHSFMVQYFGSICKTDYGITMILNEDLNLEKIPKYSIIIIDEAQDLNPLYYEICCMIMNNNSNDPSNSFRICIIGDRNQAIYKYNNSDARYMKYAENFFNFNKKPWVKFTLTETFRLTTTLTNFINFLRLDNYGNTLVDFPKIISHKEPIGPVGPEGPIRYIICNTFTNRVYREVLYYLQKGYSYSDIFILAPSTKCLKNLCNKLTSGGIPIYCSFGDINIPVETSETSKIILSSFHQVKGLERKVVILFNFDNSYFIYYNKTDSKNLPNELYVGMTRASERISLIHNYSEDFLEFLSKGKTESFTRKILSKFCYIEGTLKLKKKNASSFSKEITVSVTDLVKHIPIEKMNEFISYINITRKEFPDFKINIPSVTHTDIGCEFIADINGIVIPSCFEYYMTGESTVEKLADQKIDNDLIKEFSNIPGEKSIDDSCIFIDDDDDQEQGIQQEITKGIPQDIIRKLIYSSLKWNAITNNVFFRMKQIESYEWLSEDIVNNCIKRMEKHISKNTDYEVFKEFIIEVEGPIIVKLKCYIDAIDYDKNNIWEFKCVNELESSHILQLALYMFIMIYSDKSPERKDYNFLIFNIITNDIFKIENNSNLLKLVEELIKYKYPVIIKDSETNLDKQFILKNLKIYYKYKVNDER